ncbi:MAG: choice-of-anchor D domain-containing protein, partial [Steroidobacteraceae bacterium]
MACLNITNGLFITVAPAWQGLTTAMTPAGATIQNTSSGLSITKGGDTEFFTAPTAGSVRFVTFGNPANNILVLTINGTTRSVVLVDTTGSTIDTELLMTVSAPSAVSLPDVQPSQGNGSVFLLVGPTGTGTVHTVLCRSDNGALFCSAVPFSPAGQVIGEATSTQLLIKEGGTIRGSAAKPAGVCDITPDPQNYPDAVLGPGVDPALASHVRQFTIRNTGTDCLTVSAIGNAGPYSVTSTSKPLPAVLDPTQTMTVDVRFAPAAFGTFNVDLPVTRAPANGDQLLRCRGLARAPVRTISFSASTSFGSVPVGGSSVKNLTISNTGEAAVNLTLAAAPAGSSFQWAAFNGAITAGGSPVVIPITFSPSSEGAQSATLSFTSDVNGSPHSVSLNGFGCVARGRIQVLVPPGPVVSFGDVQRGFRTVRLVRVQNTGNGPLNFRASIIGSSLFGLQTESGSITSPASTITFAVNPTSHCGAGPTGAGSVLFAVTFFADAAPGLSNAQLVIDNHNDASAPAVLTFPLEANIVEVINVDVHLVLDRSGSMSETSGPRSKIATAIDAGHLFVQLGRPDVDDRIGLTKFNQAPNVFSTIAPITTANQGTISARINGSELTSSGSTAIAGGVIEALRDIAANPRPIAPTQLSQAVVVLTDGKDNTPYVNPDDNVTYSLLGGGGTTALPTPSGTRIYGIGIGDNVDTGRLGQLAQATNGQFLHIVTFAGLDYFKLEKHLTQIYMDTVDLATILDPTYLIAADQEHVIDFEVLRGDVALMVVLYDRDGIRLPFHLRTAGGEIVELSSLPPGYQIRPGITSTARFIEVRLPALEPERYTGTWRLTIQHDGQACVTPGFQSGHG